MNNSIFPASFPPLSPCTPLVVMGRVLTRGMLAQFESGFLLTRRWVRFKGPKPNPELDSKGPTGLKMNRGVWQCRKNSDWNERPRTVVLSKVKSLCLLVWDLLMEFSLLHGLSWQPGTAPLKQAGRCSSSRTIPLALPENKLLTVLQTFALCSAAVPKMLSFDSIRIRSGFDWDFWVFDPTRPGCKSSKPESEPDSKLLDLTHHYSLMNPRVSLQLTFTWHSYMWPCSIKRNLMSLWWNCLLKQPVGHLSLRALLIYSTRRCCRMGRAQDKLLRTRSHWVTTIVT